MDSGDTQTPLLQKDSAQSSKQDDTLSSHMFAHQDGYEYELYRKQDRRQTEEKVKRGEIIRSKYQNKTRQVAALQYADQKEFKITKNGKEESVFKTVFLVGAVGCLHCPMDNDTVRSKYPNQVILWIFMIFF